MINPIMRPFLQPMYKWLTAMVIRQSRQSWGQVKARPTDAVNLVADHLARMFQGVPPPHHIVQPQASITAATDAGARTALDACDAVVGGWYNIGQPNKETAWWFWESITPTDHPWAYTDGTPQRKIAALELYGTLLLYKHIVLTHPDLAPCVQIPLATDNRGNAYQVTNHKAKNDTAAAMLMEMALIQQANGCTLTLRHVYREHNEWADQLAHRDSSGFSEFNCIRPEQDDWILLHKLVKT
jgi:hypothetical protein